MSSAYRELTSEEEILRVASGTETAWQHPAIPMRQYELVRHEIETFRVRKNNEPFSAFIRCLEQMSGPIMNERGSRLLDVGASAGYYGEILKMIGWRGQYTACDSSRAFVEMAQGVYPGIDFDLCDARSLPYCDEWFDVVLSGGCIMHIYEWRKVIRELARVSGHYVILHRTPISETQTRYFEKIAYDVRCLEIHFNENDLFEECVMAGLMPKYQTTIFWDTPMKYGHRSYLLENPARLRNGLRHLQV